MRNEKGVETKWVVFGGGWVKETSDFLSFPPLTSSAASGPRLSVVILDFLRLEKPAAGEARCCFALGAWLSEAQAVRNGGLWVGAMEWRRILPPPNPINRMLSETDCDANYHI